MQKHDGADRMSEMTFKKGSQVWNIQYTTQKRLILLLQSLLYKGYLTYL